MTSCSMLPHTSAGVTSVALRTSRFSSGRRRHVGVLLSAVAVTRMSGWWTSRGELGEDVSVIVGMGLEEEEEEGEFWAHVPMTFIVSPE